MLRSNGAPAPQLLSPRALEPVRRNKRSHRDEKPAHRIKEHHLLSATNEPKTNKITLKIIFFQIKKKIHNSILAALMDGEEMGFVCPALL